jgi:DNA mismatch repair ATPase MutS
MKAYLLYEDHDFNFDAELPHSHEDVVQDLELTTLLEAMARGDKFLFEVSKRVLLTGLNDPDAISYRQRILADCIEEPNLIREMYGVAVEALEVQKNSWGFSSRYPSSILSAGVSSLELFVILLKHLRQVADSHSEKFRSEGLTTLFRTLKRELDDDYFYTVNRHLKQLRFRDGELISMELDRDNSGIGYVLRSPEHAKVSWKERIGIGPRTSYSFTIPPRDEAGANALGEMTSRGINLVANALAQSTDHIQSYFTMLRAELGFYVSCLNLYERLNEKEEPICVPGALPERPLVLSFDGLYDVCLSLRVTECVIGNELNAEGKSLIMITGANSGGKSTFLRSVGVARLMMQSGMFVAAHSFRASVSEGLFTHFIREEDATMSSGRLDEEMSRMNDIAEAVSPRCVVLFNESFASTNEREGSEIARQIIRGLLEADVTVFYVTHLYDLAESFYLEQSGSTLFLRAERQVDGQRSFKLVEAEPLPTSFGEDLYQRLGGFMMPAVASNAGSGGET